MEIEYTINDLPIVASKIMKHAKHKTLLFNGEMGSGKTTLIKEIIKQFGIEDTISSPTFSLVNEYISSKNELIFHFDCYRIEDEEEALNMGIEDYFNRDAWCFIEWPKNVENLLPLSNVVIEIEIIDECRRVLRVL